MTGVAMLSVDDHLDVVRGQNFEALTNAVESACVHPHERTVNPLALGDRQIAW